LELEDHAFEREINVDNNIDTSFMVDDKSISTTINTYLPGQIIIKYPQTVTTKKTFDNTMDANSIMTSTQQHQHHHQLSVVPQPEGHTIIPACIMPHDHYQAVITQNHLNHIQRNIFLTPPSTMHTTIPSDYQPGVEPLLQTRPFQKVNALQRQVEQLQHILTENERERQREKMQQLEQKYVEARQEMRDSRMEKIINEATKPRVFCIIQ
jgi:hypothetical protein